jgi:hypothetical protein
MIPEKISKRGSRQTGHRRSRKKSGSKISGKWFPMVILVFVISQSNK